ncbi:hypothetical protein PGB90_004664 [Kerria lacca]
MEDSIKSTPLKYTENTNNKQQVEELQPDQYEHHICETTTVYSPVKNESIRKIQFVTTDNIGSDSQTEHVRLINTENLNETRKNKYDLLKSRLQLRLREVETETDAFRGENSHLGKLRDDYEKEYSKFCSEKVHFLATII